LDVYNVNAGTIDDVLERKNEIKINKFNASKPYPNFIRFGWGLTHNSTHLFLSDGTDLLHLIRKQTLAYEGLIHLK
jgi:glutamine cyclotransferase